MSNKNIVTRPDNKINDFTVIFNVCETRHEFRIFTNVGEDDMPAVLESWFALTDDYTPDALINYINSKNKYGFEARAAYSANPKK